MFPVGICDIFTGTSIEISSFSSFSSLILWNPRVPTPDKMQIGQVHDSDIREFLHFKCVCYRHVSQSSLLLFSLYFTTIKAPKNHVIIRLDKTTYVIVI